MSFVKIHGVILRSSIWLEPHHVRIVWITMLALADVDGIVEASVGGLAIQAQVSREECEEALKVLTGPDPDSRDGSSGERIEKVPGGWFILNHAEYRDRQTTAQKRAADRARKYRENKKLREEEKEADDVMHHGNHARHELSDSEASERDDTLRKRPKVAPVSMPDGVDPDDWAAWLHYRKTKGKPTTDRVVKLLVNAATKAGKTVAECVRICADEQWLTYKAHYGDGKGKPNAPNRRTARDRDKGTMLDPDAPKDHPFHTKL